MSYSCADFCDEIISKLAVVIPHKYEDSPADQADICVKEIERLQRLEQSVLLGLDLLRNTGHEKWFIAHIKVAAAVQNKREAV